jgi:hypothetical protein
MAAENRGILNLLPPPTNLLLFLVSAFVVVGPAGLRGKSLLALQVFAFEQIVGGKVGRIWLHFS